MAPRPFVACLLALVVSAGCTGEEPVEIDLTETVPPTVAPEAGDDDPNAGVREELKQLAEQQCRDDPAKEQGTVRIVDPATNEVVSEYVVDCSEVN